MQKARNHWRDFEPSFYPFHVVFPARFFNASFVTRVTDETACVLLLKVARGAISADVVCL
jgi:hypothetical protein